jgi:hypothetical protein
MIQFFRKALLLIAISLPFFSYAQDESDLIEFLNAGPKDASKLMNAYLNPVIEGLSYGFNGGWYTTAKAHKPLGFDIGVSLNAVFIPSSKNYFKPADLNLDVAMLTSPTTGKAPTIAGPEDPTTYAIDIDGDNQPDDIDGNGQPDTFNGPEGLDFKENIKISGVLAPTAQIGIGVYKNTDLKIRWMPEVEAGSTKVKLFGVGVLHDIKQHIPGIKVLPFDLSVLVAYTNIKGTSGVSGTFDAPTSDPRPQELDYNMNAWLFQALISKKLAIFTFHGGLGFNTISTDADLTGSYIVVAGTPQGTFKDPVSLRFKNNSMRVSAGMRMNFGPIYLNGEYTLQEYSTVSVGLGVTVR